MFFNAFPAQNCSVGLKHHPESASTLRDWEKSTSPDQKDEKKHWQEILGNQQHRQRRETPYQVKVLCRTKTTRRCDIGWTEASRSWEGGLRGASFDHKPDVLEHKKKPTLPWPCRNSLPISRSDRRIEKLPEMQCCSAHSLIRPRSSQIWCLVSRWAGIQCQLSFTLVSDEDRDFQQSKPPGQHT